MRMICRIFSVLAAAVLAAGCANASDGKARDDLLATAAAPYSFTGTAEAEGISQPVKLTVTKAADGLTVTLLEPETVQGLTVKFGEESIKASFRGLVMNLLPNDIPQQSLFIALRDLLSSAPDGDAQIGEGDGIFTISGKAGMLPYEMLWSAEGPALKEIKMPSIGGVIRVESFTKN